MKTRTDGFNKYRLIEARQARGLTQTSLAEMIGVTRQQVSLYEKGGNSPSEDTLKSIVSILGFPARFFFTSSAVKRNINAPIFYRSMSTATKTARSRAEWRIKWLKEITRYVNTYLELPAVNLPAFDVPDDPREISGDDIELYAQECRRYWGLGDGYISDLILLLEKNGIIVTRGDLGADTLDALSEWCDEDGRPYIHLSTAKESAARVRFDAAHELGHLVLHRKIDNKLLKTPEVFKLIEKQAHRFSGAFHLPSETYSNQLRAATLDAFLAVKRGANVSIGMQISRCFDLDLIDDLEKRRLFINYNRRGWKRQEPLDDQVPSEQPRLLRKSILLLIDEGIVTKSAIKHALPYRPADICELAGLQCDYLDIEDCVISEFPDVKLKNDDGAKFTPNVVPMKKNE